MPAAAFLALASMPALALAQVPGPGPFVPANPNSTMTKFGQSLLDEGIHLRSAYTGDAAGNVTGGLRQGGDYADELNLGTDLDMAKLAGIPGAAIHITVSGRTGRDISIDDVGNNVLANQIYGGQSIRLSEFTWDQALFNKRLVIIGGRMNSAIFGNSPINCNFMTNATCGHLDSLFRAVGMISYPYAAWGARANVQATDRVSLMTGIFEVNPKQSAYGRDDLNFTLQNDTGAVVPMELDYATTFKQSAFPTVLEFGGYWDTSKYKDPAYNTTGGLLAEKGGTAATHFGRTGVYTFFNQVVYRPDMRNTRNLRLFGGFTHSLDEPEEIQWGADLGALYTGPFDSRPLDAVGFIGTVMHFGGRELTYLKNERAIAGGSGTPAANEFVFELNYGVQANDWLRLSCQTCSMW